MIPQLNNLDSINIDTDLRKTLLESELKVSPSQVSIYFMKKPENSLKLVDFFIIFSNLDEFSFENLDSFG